MDFAYALNALKEGRKVQRSGWNGKGMYIVKQDGYPEGVPINENTAKAIGEPIGTVKNFLPYIVMCTAQGDFVPWLASQTDILAEDWNMVKREEEKDEK
jgi:hypothetical protein